jgi:predicted phage terminase large subunit-like protein
MLGWWPGPNNENVFYVDAELRHEADYVGRALDIAERFCPQELIAESNCTMGLLMPEIDQQLRERTARGRPLSVRAREVYHTQSKLWRIRGLTTYLSRGQIKVRNTPGGRMLVEQMRDVPNGQHEDGPDALATAVLHFEQLMSGRA